MSCLECMRRQLYERGKVTTEGTGQRWDRRWILLTGIRMCRVSKLPEIAAVRNRNAFCKAGTLSLLEFHIKTAGPTSTRSDLCLKSSSKRLLQGLLCRLHVSLGCLLLLRKSGNNLTLSLLQELQHSSQADLQNLDCAGARLTSFRHHVSSA